MTNADKFQDFNSEFIRFIAFASKQKSIQKILDAACKLCSTLPSVQACRIFALNKRDQSTVLITHTDAIRDHGANRGEPYELSIEALEKLKGETAIFDHTQILIPLRGYREIFGVVHINHTQSQSPEGLLDIIQPVSEFLSKIVTDFGTIADLKER